MATTRLTGTEAIERAERDGRTLSKHADPTEGAREGLTAAEARDVAREDPSLIYLDVMGIETQRTAEAWWTWHDEAYDRHYATMAEAEVACAAWVAGERDAAGPS